MALDVGRKKLIGDFEAALSAKDSELHRAHAAADTNAKARPAILVYTYMN